MKRYRILLCICIWLVATCGWATTVDVKTNIWSGSQEMTAAWKGYVKVSASSFTDIVAGETLSVTLSDVASSGAKIALKAASSGWPLLTGTAITTLDSDATEYTLTITDDIATELKTSGLVVGGCSYTATSIDVVKKVELSDVEKGNPVTVIWSGSNAIDWTTGANKSWQTLNSTIFANAAVGQKLRFHFSNLKIGAQAHIATNAWGSMPDATEYISLSSTEFEYTITTDMLTELQTNGCQVTGIGYTLTEVDLLDPTQLPLITATVNKADIKAWDKTETPVIRVDLQSLESKSTTVNVEVTIRTDAYEDVATVTEEVTVGGGETTTATVTLPTLTAGFYHATVSANYEEVKDFNIGYDATGISSPADAQSDFDTFWANAKTALAAIEPNYTLTKIDDKSTSKRNVYLVEMNSIDDGDGNPVTIHAYYAEPVADGTYPVIITQNGYDSDTSIDALNFCPNGDSNPEWIELNVSVRGQIINNRTPNTNIYGDWFAYNFGNKDKYYYRGAYMDVVRSIDFIASREKAQQSNIFMMGGSQGGALTIAGAALDDRINAIAPSIQFMGDFVDYFKVGAWPRSVALKQQSANNMTDEAMYTFLSYFDTKNLATKVTCPVKTAIGLQDPVCPPHTGMAAYNNMASTEKEYVINSECKHETTSTWYSECLAFFEDHLQTEYTNVNLSIWNGSLSFNDEGWKVYLTLPAEKFTLAAEGDELWFSVPSLIEGMTNPIMMLNNGSWSVLADSETHKFTEAPTTYKLTITSSMLTELQSNGLIVKGVGYVLSDVTLSHKVTVGDSENKGNAITNVWSGDPVAISWVTGSNHSELIAASDLTWLEAGMKVRVSYTGLGVATATGRILAGWTAFTDVKNTTFNGGTYYEYTLTDDMVSLIQTNGLRVSGNAYTLTSVDIIDPTKQYNIFCQITDSDIKAWKNNETPRLTMTMTNVETIDVTVPYKVLISNDMVDTDTETRDVAQTYTQDVTIASGETKSVAIEFSQLTEPGFYKMTALVDGNEICTYNIGYDIDNIAYASTAKDDFWSYWDAAKEDLAAVDMEVSMEELTDKSTTKRKIYLVSMKSTADTADGDPVTIRGYYAEPVNEGSYPTILHFQGTDGGSSTPWCMDADDNENYCEFILSTRGQMLNNRDPYLSDNVYGRNESTGKTDYYSYGWGDKTQHYYRGAYLDCVRAVDFLKSRDKVDSNNLFAVGGSQGGCFTYVAAGLTGAFKAIAPSITGHADFEEGMRIVNWPRANFLAAKENLGWTTEQMNEFNSYYDVMNFSEHISCPVITSFSLQDATDPARTNLAPYALLTKVAAADKQYVINSFLGHATSSTWKSEYMAFFEKYISNDDQTALREVNNAATPTEQSAIYTIAGVRVSSMTTPGLYVSNGRKVIIR